MAKRRTLRVMNITQKQMLVQRGRVADSFLTRLMGLMGTSHLAPGEGLLIKPCSSIHTHFMRFPIDVLYLDEEGRVVDMDRAMPTWRIGRRRSAACCVIELPSGTLTQYKCDVGDRLEVSY